MANTEKEYLERRMVAQWDAFDGITWRPRRPGDRLQGILVKENDKKPKK